MSNGEEVVVRAAMKPLPTLMRPLRSVDLETGEPAEALVERSDVAAVEALSVVAEASVAFELARAAREKFGGDAIGDFVGSTRRLPRAHPVVGAVDKHLALIGFMGAGKSTLGRELAQLHGSSVRRHRRGDREALRPDRRALRARRARVPPDRGAGRRGGARRPDSGDRARGRGSLSEAHAGATARTAFVVWVPVDVDTAW